MGNVEFHCSRTLKTFRPIEMLQEKGHLFHYLQEPLVDSSLTWLLSFIHSKRRGKSKNWTLFFCTNPAWHAYCTLWHAYCSFCILYTGCWLHPHSQVALSKKHLQNVMCNIGFSMRHTGYRFVIYIERITLLSLTLYHTINLCSHS